ncbi:lamin tail domain-containing protein 1 [Melopsittacus undulatus]|uniref:lamin tail domain-containing protein 1 n=1 Tax=Melopsittacus undulatus TaxID=13146 RepID=UPI00146CF64B|nr:lamin tail domain-containing protein 1 [Melopsittacus undulatus]
MSHWSSEWEAQDLRAKKEALNGVQEKHVFLETEIESIRDVAGRRRSAIGNLKIDEVDQGGRFVKIRNHATKEDENIGGYLLKQDIKGQPVAVFRFPSETRMEPNSTVTVWAADSMVIHRFPSDLLWKDLKRFRTSLDCTTVLCEPSGQAVAWYTSLYWTTMQELVATGESEEPENIVIPTFSTTREQCEKESAITDTEWNVADPWQTSKKRPSFIKREKKTFSSLYPNQSAWCQSPNTPTHPHFSLGRPLTMGNDGSSLCRQSRCQSSRPDPVPELGSHIHSTIFLDREKLGTEGESALAT